MSTITTYMSLTAWDQSTDAYSHAELANNWLLVDGHDHSSGKGKQIPTGGLADHSVTTIKLAEPAVGTTNYVDGSITIDKLDITLLDALFPMGLVVPWWRPSGSVDVLYGSGRSSGKLFELCDGHTVLAADHDFGGGDIVLPNLIDKFIFFGVIGNLGQTGGANSQSFAHSHTVNPHSHTVDPHAHSVNAHYHTVADHQHTIVTDGSHRHRWDSNYGGVGGPVWNDTAQRPYTTASGSPANDRQALYVPGFNDGETSASIQMETTGGHNHGGQTAGATTVINTSSDSPNTSAASPGTDSQSPGTNSALGAIDIRPAFMTLVPVVRVRRS